MGTPARLALFGVAAFALALAPLFKLPAFAESILYLVFFWIALATSWAIFSGFSGYFSFGHGAFVGAGMYTTANLSAKWGLPFVWTLPIAGLTAMLFGLLIGVVVFRVRRLRGELFALLTLAIGFILATIVRNTPIDNGRGVSLATATMPDFYVGPSSTLYLFALLLAAASLLIAWIVQYSKLGRGLFAISDDEDVAEVMGIPTFAYKLAALGLSCFLAGLAGGIHAGFVGYVTAEETFSITVPLYVMLMSIVGGARHWFGPAIGAILITALEQAFVSGEWALAGRAAIGLIFVAAVIFLPQGATGLLENRSRRNAQAREIASTAATTLSDAAPAAPAPPPAAPLLVCRDVRLSFRGIKALAGVSLDVREGEILGLVGPNGSGKSTLVNVISGFYRPQAGQILLGDLDLAKTPAHRIAQAGIARTYQIPRPFQRLSVLENVALPAMFGRAALSPGLAEKEAREWLKFVGLGNRMHAVPTELNLHQRKFLELARALAAHPRLILLDEVLAGLTPSEVGGAIALVQQIRSRGATIIFIEHNMRAVLALSDRLVVLSYGEVIAAGTGKEVVRRPEVINAYLGTSYA
jgi:branched-chain amino acid transport system permease protein